MASKIDFSPTPWSSGVSGFSNGLQSGSSLGLAAQQKRINERQMQLMEIQQAEKQLAEQKKVEFEKAKAAASILLDKASAMKGAPSAWKAHMKQAAIPAINALLPEEYQVDLDGLDLDNDDDAKAVSEMTSIAEAVAKGKLGRDDAAFAMNAIANRYGASEDMRKTAMDQAKFYLDASTKKTQAPSAGGINTSYAVPGFDVTGEVTPEDTEVKKLREQVAEANAFKDTLARYRGLVEKYGTYEALDRRTAGEMKALAKNLQLKVKNLAQLGVLSAGDVPFIEGQIPEPGILKTRKGMLGALDTAGDLMEKSVLSKAESIGYRRKGAVKTNPQNAKLSGLGEDSPAPALSELAESEAWAAANPSDPRANTILRRTKAIRRFIGGGQ